MPHKLSITRDDLSNILSIVMPRPSNFHDHLRQGAMMRAIAAQSMRWVLYLLVMPNSPLIRTMQEALEYHATLRAIAEQHAFAQLQLIMMLYHTADITPAVIEEIAKSSIVRAIKDYPSHKGATTGSGYGIPLEDNPNMLCAMQETGVPLLGHFEDTHDQHNRLLPHEFRESHCVQHRLWRLRDKYPRLRICCEHASTLDMVAFVKADRSGNTVMTVTPQHMDIDCTRESFSKSWGNTLKCMPIAKSREHCEGVAKFATSGDRRVILGTDNAPHPSKTKMLAFDACSFGCFTPHALAQYAKVFNRHSALDDRFVNFACLNGPRWWGLPLPAEDDTVTIRRELARDIPDPTMIPEDNDIVLPLGYSLEPDRLKIGFVLD